MQLFDSHVGRKNNYSPHEFIQHIYRFLWHDVTQRNSIELRRLRNYSIEDET